MLSGNYRYSVLNSAPRATQAQYNKQTTYRVSPGGVLAVLVWGCSGFRVAGREVKNASQKFFSVCAKKRIFKHTTSIGKVKVLSMKNIFMKKNSQCYHTFGNTDLNRENAGPAMLGFALL